MAKNSGVISSLLVRVLLAAGLVGYGFVPIGARTARDGSLARGPVVSVHGVRLGMTMGQVRSVLGQGRRASDGSILFRVAERDHPSCVRIRWVTGRVSSVCGEQLEMDGRVVVRGPEYEQQLDTLLGAADRKRDELSHFREVAKEFVVVQRMMRYERHNLTFTYWFLLNGGRRVKLHPPLMRHPIVELRRNDNLERDILRR